VAEISATRAAICRPLIACIIRVSTAASRLCPRHRGPLRAFYCECGAIADVTTHKGAPIVSYCNCGAIAECDVRITGR
jgi:hypothetical protein